MCPSVRKGLKCRRLATSTHSPASYQLGTNLQMCWHLEHGFVAGDRGGQGQQQEADTQEEHAGGHGVAEMEHQLMWS